MPRARGPANIRQRDLDVAIATVQKRGLSIASVEIGLDGRIILVLGEPTSEHNPSVAADDWGDAR